MQADSRRRACNSLGAPHRHQSGDPVRQVCNEPSQDCFTTAVLLPQPVWKAMRNALTDSGPVVSLKRRDGLKSLPVAGLRTIANAKVFSCSTACGRQPWSHPSALKIRKLELSLFHLRQHIFQQDRIGRLHNHPMEAPGEKQLEPGALS